MIVLLTASFIILKRLKMIILKVFLIVISGITVVRTGKSNYVIEAIISVVKFHYVKNSLNFDFVVFGKVRKLNDIVNELMLRNNELFSGKILHFDESSNRFELPQSAILFFESTTFFIRFKEKVVMTNKFTKPLTFLAYFATGSKVDLLFYTQLFAYLFTIFHDPDGSLVMQKYSRYDPNHCGNVFVENINRFSLKSLEWEKSIVLDHEIGNFHGCSVRIGIVNLHKPFAYHKILDDGSFEVLGLTVSFWDALANHYNFRIRYSPVDVLTGKCLDKTPLPNMIPQHSGLQDIILSNYESQIAEIISSDSYGFIIPYGELYTPLEKLFLPFDLETWIWFTVFMVTGIVVIEIIKRTPRRVQDFVFGQNVSTPIINLVQAFFGVSQNRLPGRNFARYLLTMFLLFCLIMRTAYQGKMFEFLQKDMRKPEVASVEEMIANNFTFFAIDSNLEFFRTLEIFRGFV